MILPPMRESCSTTVKRLTRTIPKWVAQVTHLETFLRNAGRNCLATTDSRQKNHIIQHHPTSSNITVHTEVSHSLTRSRRRFVTAFSNAEAKKLRQKKLRQITEKCLKELFGNIKQLTQRTQHLNITVHLEVVVHTHKQTLRFLTVFSSAEENRAEAKKQKRAEAKQEMT